MDVQNYAVGQRGMHGGLKRRARISRGGIDALAQALSHLRQIQRYENFIAQASAIHRPEALIQRTPSSFMELLPVLACVSRESLPTRSRELQ